MKIEARKIKFLLSLELEDEEIRLLNTLSSFDIASIITQHLTKQYKDETWKELFTKIRNLTDEMCRQMNDAHNVFTGLKVARERDRV